MLVGSICKLPVFIIIIKIQKERTLLQELKRGVNPKEGMYSRHPPPSKLLFGSKDSPELVHLPRGGAEAVLYPCILLIMCLIRRKESRR